MVGDSPIWAKKFGLGRLGIAKEERMINDGHRQQIVKDGQCWSGKVRKVQGSSRMFMDNQG